MPSMNLRNAGWIVVLRANEACGGSGRSLTVHLFSSVSARSHRDLGVHDHSFTVICSCVRLVTVVGDSCWMAQAAVPRACQPAR